MFEHLAILDFWDHTPHSHAFECRQPRSVDLSTAVYLSWNLKLLRNF